MKKIIILSLTLALFVSCGKGGEAGSLSEMKAKKADLQQQLEALKTQIETLDEKIAKLEPSTTGNAVFVEVDTLSPQLFKNYVATQGFVTSEKNIMVSPEIPGIITKVLVKEGDNVRKGQLMASMDASALQSQLQQINASYLLAETTYERTARLWEQNIGSEMQLLQAEANKKSLEAQMNAVKAQIANTQMTAPVSGTVDAVNIKLGEMASPGMNGIRVVNMSELKVTATLADRYASQIKKGDEIKIFLPDLNDTLVEKISFVSQAIDPQSRTITVEAILGNEHKRLKPNMVAKLEINNYTAENATVIPSNVLLRNGDGTAAYYVLGIEKTEDGYIAKRYDVEIGNQNGEQTEVLSGLPKNAAIITSGFGNVAEGQAVKF